MSKLVSRSVRLVATTLVAFGVAAPSASADLRRHDCGSYPVLNEATGEYGWGYGELDGAGNWNVVARGVTCTVARRVSLKASPGRSYRGWKCRYLQRSYEYSKIRCSRSSGRTVSWQAGA